MRQRLRSKLTYANVMVTILAFLVLGGSTALASYVISSNSQVGPDTISGHTPSRIYHANIISGSVNGLDLATGSVSGSDVQNGSLTQLDIAGADVSQTISISVLPPTSCFDFTLNVPGAKVGDVVLWSFKGNVSLPLRLIMEPIRVSAPDTVQGRVCNPSQNFTSGVSNLGMRVLTLR